MWVLLLLLLLIWLLLTWVLCLVVWLQWLAPGLVIPLQGRSTHRLICTPAAAELDAQAGIGGRAAHAAHRLAARHGSRVPAEYVRDGRGRGGNRLNSTAGAVVAAATAVESRRRHGGGTAASGRAAARGSQRVLNGRRPHNTAPGGWKPHPRCRAAVSSAVAPRRWRRGAGLAGRTKPSEQSRAELRQFEFSCRMLGALPTAAHPQPRKLPANNPHTQPPDLW